MIDINMRLNHLFADFLHCDTLFRTYCMIIMAVRRGDIMATIWKFFILHGERQFAEFGKYHIERIIIPLI